MPEMPEVEIIRRGLEKRLPRQKIAAIEILLGRLIQWPDKATFRARLMGASFEKIRRRGKYLLLALDSGCTLVVHLRMTGRLCYTEAGQTRDPYARILFHLEGGGTLVYADTRTLGTLYVLRKGEEGRVAGLASMGPEPLSAAFTLEYLSKKLQASRCKIKSFLLNQKYIGCWANIYADECLFLAGILPERIGGSLTPPEIARLYDCINRAVGDGIRDGGTTLRDYRDSSGGKGRHQKHLFVYGRTGKTCRQCGGEILRTKIGGRSAHYCPVCQR